MNIVISCLLLLVILTISQPPYCTCNVCMDTTNLRHVLHDTALLSPNIHLRRAGGLLGCVKKCLLHTECVALNYRDSIQKCEMIFDRPGCGNSTEQPIGETVQVKEVGTVYTEIKNWPAVS